MGMWNDTCKCIDENWKALKARIQASITGITVNGVTHYQNDGTGICNLGTIAGKDGITGIEGTAVGHVQMLEVTDAEGNTEYKSIGQFDGTQFDVTVDSETGIPQFVLSTDADSPVGKAVNWIEPLFSDDKDTLLTLMLHANSGNKGGPNIFSIDADYLKYGVNDYGKLLTLSDNAKTVADNAMMFINPGKGSSSDGQLTVPAFYGPSMSENRTLIFKAGEYLSITDGNNPTLDVSADTIAVLNSAKETADSAYTLADTANTAALNAYNLAYGANTKANAAYKGFGTAVVGSNLEATLDKGDGSSETKQLFSIGDGLEWADTVLKATGGSSMPEDSAIDANGVYKSFTELFSTYNDGEYLFSFRSSDGDGIKCQVATKCTCEATAYGYKLTMKASSTVNVGGFNGIAIVKKIGNTVKASGAIFNNYNTYSTVALTVDSETNNVTMENLGSIYARFSYDSSVDNYVKYFATTRCNTHYEGLSSDASGSSFQSAMYNPSLAGYILKIA